MRIPDLSVYDDLPDATLLNHKDVIRAFGYKNLSGGAYIHDGLIPKPTMKGDAIKRMQSRWDKGYSKMSKRTNFWRLGDLRKLKIELESE